MGQIQDEGADIGSPEGLERIPLPSGGAVLLEAGQKGGIVQTGENCRQLAMTGILRNLTAGVTVKVGHDGNHDFPSGWGHRHADRWSRSFCAYMIAELSVIR